MIKLRRSAFLPILMGFIIVISITCILLLVRKGSLHGQSGFTIPSPTTPEIISVSPSPIGTTTTNQPSPTTQIQHFAIPSTWKTYSKIFQNLHFSFSYPSNLSIFDGDPDSGNIELRTGQTKVLETGRLSYYGLPEYSGGDPKTWFIQSALKGDSSSGADQNSYILSPLNFTNGNIYYLIEGNRLANGQFPWLTGLQDDVYFSILNGKSIIVSDSKILPKDDVLRVMQSLSVK